jgi:nucleoside-diphosphate-sugar epimerase
MSFYLVTGGGGFIGSHMVRYLLKENARVRIMDNFLTGNRKNLSEIADRIELLEGDLRDQATVFAATQNIDYVIHLGALPSVPRSVNDPALTTAINVNGTVNLLQAAVKNNVKRVVFASSSSVYGDSPVFPRRESQPPQPLSPYAVSKLAGEFYLQCFYKLHGLETTALRFFNVFGPRQDPNSQYAAVIPRFIEAVLHDKQPTVYGDGEQTRDFTYVDDLVAGIYAACHAQRAAGEILNVACERRTSLNQLLKLLQEVSGKTIRPAYTAPRAGDVRDSLADIAKAKDILGFAPKFSVAEGLAITFKWYQSQNGFYKTN